MLQLAILAAVTLILPSIRVECASHLTQRALRRKWLWTGPTHVFYLGIPLLGGESHSPIHNP